jgi:hypothetical protein
MAYTYSEINLSDVIRGDVLELTFEVSEDYPLTGKKVKAQFKEAADIEVSVLEFNTENGSIEKNGQFIVLRKKASQMNIAVGRYVYDVQFYTDADDVVTLFGGTFKVKQDVTR